EGEVGVAARVGGLQLDVRRGLLRAPEERRDADRRLTVVVAPAGERAGPVLRDDAVVGVEARRRQAAKAGQVLKHAGDERAGGRREAVLRVGIMEQVLPALPKGEVDMAAVARVLGPGLRGERGDEAVVRGHAADRLAYEHLLVGGAEGGRVLGRE